MPGPSLLQIDYEAAVLAVLFCFHHFRKWKALQAEILVHLDTFLISRGWQLTAS
jgi:hypothetical protein